ncbi:ribose 5-phosphate isomerase A [Mucilaginibacter sp. JRF]|uniref:ribose 5-phosphate isomerase A n=1 Tax=Mucilaginibacter sp. JRF TaxID=2780088 RepID=UPI001881FE24|nr:ribose 5-phosphate isomerase A [Mucilaginibacter sp. JRF]MBE9584639.1 ribose 5-phosphate isomerase A [Mucilaginibacter sp. JRF]
MNYKEQAAAAAAKLVKPNQAIGLGAGNTIAFLVDTLAADAALAATLRFVSSSTDTADRIKQHGLALIDAGSIDTIDIYFDGCDQLDNYLNALKSGAGIHTDEKMLAGMAKEFILLGDAAKLTQNLNTQYSLTVEVLPTVLTAVSNSLNQHFDIRSITVRTNNDNQFAQNSRGALLLDVYFNNLPELTTLNNIKMWPGIIDHSLFYKMATAAVIAGADGVQHLTPAVD